MLIEVSTDGTIQDDKNFSAEVKVVVCAELDRYSNGISRVDVYLSGANGQTAGYGDKCCLIKARRDGREPIVVMHQEGTMGQAILGGMYRLQHSIERAFGNQSNRSDFRDHH